MPRAARWLLLVAMAMSMWAAPSAVVARHTVLSTAPDSTIDTPTATTPEPTTPEPTTPDSAPVTTEPDSSTPGSSGNDALIDAGDPDSDINSTTAAISVVGFVLVLALAGWWMVRRTDPDAEPMPRPHPEPPPNDLI